MIMIWPFQRGWRYGNLTVCDLSFSSNLAMLFERGFADRVSKWLEISKESARLHLMRKVTYIQEFFGPFEEDGYGRVAPLRHIGPP